MINYVTKHQQVVDNPQFVYLLQIAHYYVEFLVLVFQIHTFKVLTYSVYLAPLMI